MATAEKVISIALAEVGYWEKASNASLDDPTANAGSGNWTKYARDLAAAGYYNGNKNGYAWCDVFVDWCFYKACGSKAAAEAAQCQTGTLGAAVNYSAGYYKAKGRYDKTPRKGDQVFFQQNGELVHTGIVAEVTATQIVTVEGNSSDQVKKNTYSRTSSYIAGYGHPIYDGSSSGGDTPAPTPTPGHDNHVGAACSVSLALCKSGHSGPMVKTIQRILYSYGYKGADGKPIAVDGEYGANTAYAVKTMQARLGLAADGQVGKDTWAAMLTKLW